MFQIERLMVLHAPLLQDDIARKRCRKATIIISICVSLITLSSLDVYWLNMDVELSIETRDNVIPCFVNKAKSFIPLYDAYVVTFLFFYLLPVTALPIINLVLLFTIRNIINAQTALRFSKTASTGRGGQNKRNEINSSISSMIISIYTTICLSPNLLWIPITIGIFYSLNSLLFY